MNIQLFKIIVLFAISLTVKNTYAQFNPIIQLSEFSNMDGLVITNEPDGFSGLIREIGDINNDGINDLIIGPGNATINGQNIIGSYVIYGNAKGLSSPFDLSQIDGSNGFALNMDIADGGETFAINGIGDINADGIDDIILGASTASISISNAGATYVVFGQAQNFPTIFNLSSLDGTNGFIITGINLADHSGERVEIISDMNNDLINDIIISAPLAELDLNSPDVGSVYVVFGSQQTFPAVLDLASLNGNNGFVIPGEENFDFLGESISATDINNDGLSDLIVSTTRVDTSSSLNGVAYVIFGSTVSFPSIFDLSTLDGTNGFAIETIDNLPTGGSFPIINVNHGGDMNGDGIDDFTVAYPSAVVGASAYVGAVYVIYGSQQAFPDVFDLTGIDGINGFKIVGNAEFDNLGYRVNKAGDVNADGVDDLILALIKGNNPPYIDPFTAAYVIFGNADGFPAIYDPSTLNGNDGFTIKSNDGSISSVLSNVSSAGDINHDGIDDMVVNSKTGYVIYGKGDLIFESAFE